MTVFFTLLSCSPTHTAELQRSDRSLKSATSSNRSVGRWVCRLHQTNRYDKSHMSLALLHYALFFIINLINTSCTRVPLRSTRPVLSASTAPTRVRFSHSMLLLDEIIVAVRICSFDSNADCSAESSDCRLTVLGQCYAYNDGAFAATVIQIADSQYDIRFSSNCSGTSIVSVSVSPNTCLLYPLSGSLGQYGVRSIRFSIYPRFQTILQQITALFPVVPLHPVIVTLIVLSPTIISVNIAFPAYFIASDYDYVPGAVEIATSPTPSNGDLATPLIGTRTYPGVDLLVPVTPNSLLIVLPPSLLATFSSVIGVQSLYLRPLSSYLKASDGTLIDMQLTAQVIETRIYGLSSLRLVLLLLHHVSMPLPFSISIPCPAGYLQQPHSSCVRCRGQCHVHQPQWLRPAERKFEHITCQFSFRTAKLILYHTVL